MRQALNALRQAADLFFFNLNRFKVGLYDNVLFR